jgi:molybdopterin converting factor small subunit
MKVRVRSFANFREILGKDLDVDLEDGSTLKGLLDGLVSVHHGLFQRPSSTRKGM